MEICLRSYLLIGRSYSLLKLIRASRTTANFFLKAMAIAITITDVIALKTLRHCTY